MKRIMAILVAFLLPISGIAAPSISGTANGIVGQGQLLTISGSNFGSRQVATPWVWDDFESGQEGSYLKAHETANWAPYMGGGGGDAPQYRKAGAYAGSFGAAKTAEYTKAWLNYGVRGLNADEMYVTWMFKWTLDAGDLSSDLIMKFLRVNGGNAFYTGKPSAWVTMRANGSLYSNICPDANGSADGLQSGSGSLSKGSWHRWETYWKLSTPGQKNGEMRHYINGKEQATGKWADVMTRSSLMSASDKAGNFMLPMMHDVRAKTAKITYRVDNVYADRTRARVELGNKSEWSACTRREIQVSQAWTSNRVTIKVNGGTFKIGDRAYLFVVDANGVASSGYPVTIGKGAVTTIRVVPAKVAIATGIQQHGSTRLVFDVLGRNCNNVRISQVKGTSVRIGQNTKFMVK